MQRNQGGPNVARSGHYNLAATNKLPYNLDYVSFNPVDLIEED
jgi:hypothetical protein